MAALVFFALRDFIFQDRDSNCQGRFFASCAKSRITFTYCICKLGLGMNESERGDADDEPRVYKRLGLYEPFLPLVIPAETSAAAEFLSEFDYDDVNGIKS